MTDNTDRSACLQPGASFVVFDRQTGSILHTHLVSAAPGAILPPDEDLARFILDHAVHTTGRHAGDLDCLKVPADALKPRTMYRVDLAAARLIETSQDDHKHHPAPRTPRA